MTFTLSDELLADGALSDEALAEGTLVRLDVALAVSRGDVARAFFELKAADGPATRAMAGAGCAGALDVCDVAAPVATSGAAVGSGTTGRLTFPLAAVDVVAPSADVAGVAELLPLAHAATTTTVSAQPTSFILPP